MNSWSRAPGLVLVLLVAACGKSTQPGATSGSKEASVESAEGSEQGAPTQEQPPPLESKPEPELTKACPPGNSIDPASDLAAQFMTSGPVGVVLVRADDVLNVRESADPQAKVVAEFSPREIEILPTGRACNVEGSKWYEVEKGEVRGWVNGRFIAQLTTPRDLTKQYGGHAPAPASSPEGVAEAIAARIKKDHGEQTEGRFEVTVLGARVEGSQATVLLHSCCELDDSVAGSQITVEARRSGASWIFSGASGRSICYRGASGALCL